MRPRKWLALWPPLCLLLLVFAWTALAETGAVELPWSVVAGGGGTSASGAITLDGTIGQPATNTMTGGNITLTSGFWGWAALPAGTATPTPSRSYLPSIYRGQ
jgi:hypothetical protein